MNSIKAFFIRIPRSQLLALFASTYIVGQIGALMSFPSQESSSLPLELAVRIEMYILPFLLCYIGWFWSLGEFLDAKLKPSLRIRIGGFRLCAAYYLIYFSTVLLTLRVLPQEAIAISGLSAMGCIIYIANYVAKSLVTTNKGRSVTFSEYALDFFFLLTLALGVWFIQPRINQLHAETRRKAERALA